MTANNIARSLEKIKKLQKPHVGGEYPTIEMLREIWRDGKQRGKIVILEGGQEGEADDIKVGMIVSTDNNHLIRVALTSDEAINLARALVSSAA